MLSPVPLWVALNLHLNSYHTKRFFFQVIQFPIAECAPLLDCIRCLGNGNPLCGWCVVENKCSRISECQNSDDSARWIQAARTNTGQCPNITVSPEQYVVDNPQTVMPQYYAFTDFNFPLFWSAYINSVPGATHASRRWDVLLPLCWKWTTLHCASKWLRIHLHVWYHWQDTSWVWRISYRLHNTSILHDIIFHWTNFVLIVLNVSLISSLRGIPFSTVIRGLTVYRCNETSR